ncbi:T9SS type B sorting domain-containing protein [Myroides sp. LJL115]
MSKTIGLLLSVFMYLFFTTPNYGKGGNSDFEAKALLETEHSMGFLQEQQPEIKYGKPYNLTQCAGPALQDPATFYLPDAVRGIGDQANGKDQDGVAIVPFGFSYDFYKSQSDAEIQREKISSRNLWISLPKDSAPVSYYVRVYSVQDPDQYKVWGFDLVVKQEDCTIADMIVSVADLYKSVDSPNDKASFNLGVNANEAFLGNVTLYKVQLFEVVQGVRGQEILDVDNNWDNYLASNNTVIEIQVSDVKNPSNAKGHKRFTLYTEFLDTNATAALSAQQSNEETQEDKREGIFDLTQAQSQIGNGVMTPYLSISYYSDHNFTKIIENPTEFTALDGTVVYARISNPLFHANPVVVKSASITLSIIAKPVIGAFDNLTMCTDNKTQWNFDLLVLNKDILGSYPEVSEDGTTGYTVAYFDNEQDAIKNENAISNSLDVSLNEIRTLWVRLTDVETGNFNHKSFTASLGYSKITTYNYAINYCYNDVQQNTANLYAGANGVKGATVIERPDKEFYPNYDQLDVLFFENEIDAQNNTNALTREQAQNYPLGIGQKKQLYSRVKMVEGFACQSDDYKTYTISSNLSVSGSFGPEQNSLQLCNNGQDQGTIGSNVWFEPNDQQVYRVTLFKVVENNTAIAVATKIGSSKEELEMEITQDGTYFLQVTYAQNPYPDSTPCSLRSHNWQVKPVFNVFILNADATNMVNSLDIDQNGRAFVEIGVSTDEVDDFEYAIDNGAFQNYNRFDNIPIGDHVAWVRSKYSNCAVMTVFSVFGYPKYFTPNGDGYNDTWNIPGLSGHPEARINIFDRNGKLLKQMSPNNMQGWDGLYNGRQLPSTDYWFTVEFTNDLPGNDELNGRSVKYTGHFSLKR